MGTLISGAVGQEVPSGGSANWPARYAKFGKFQLDLEREELYEADKRCKIQAKVYQALLVMLSRPGEIVTREEVCKRLWPDAGEINFAANVNTTMNKLRLVLGDSPDEPVYVETIPRRGYSFIAAVQFSEEPPKPGFRNGEGRGAEQDGTASDRWNMISHFRRAPLRVLGYVLVGIVVGAMLVVVWSAVAKSHSSQDFGRQNALSIPSAPSKGT